MVLLLVWLCRIRLLLKFTVRQRGYRLCSLRQYELPAIPAFNIGRVADFGHKKADTVILSNDRNRLAGRLTLQEDSSVGLLAYSDFDSRLNRVAAPLAGANKHRVRVQEKREGLGGGSGGSIYRLR